MSSWIKNLVALQEIDLSIDLLNQKISAVPLVKKDLENQKVAAADALALEKKKIQDAEMALKKLEMDAHAVEEKIAKAQVQSNMVKKNDEYHALLKEIENSRQQLSDLEDSELETMDLLETLKENYAKAEAAYKAELATIKEKGEKLEVKAREFADSLSAAQEARESAEAKVDESKLSVYNRLRGGKKKNNLAIAVLSEEGMCGSCHLKNRTEAQVDVLKDKVVLCENCGSILYSPNAL